jgi:hypothetical protein
VAGEESMKQTRSIMSRTLPLLFAASLVGCGGEAPEATAQGQAEAAPQTPPYKQGKYAGVKLTADLSALSASEREMLPLLIDACRPLDLVFWLQVYGQKLPLLSSIPDLDARRFAEINYGPWDRLAADRPFLPVRPKPATGRFYPLDLQPNELEQAAAVSADGGASLRDPYTIVHRNENGALEAVPYHESFATHLEAASTKLLAAAAVARDPALRGYLELSAEALTTDAYGPSEEAWMRLPESRLGLIIGAIDVGEDHVARRKKAYVGAVLLNRPDWDERVARYQALLPELARGTPFQQQIADSRELTFELADLLYLAGSWNAGPKRIAFEMPADEKLRGRMGTRRVQLLNVARAKFDQALRPVAELLISPRQRTSATFDAFFVNNLALEMVRAAGSSDRSSALRALYGDRSWVVEVARSAAVGLHLAGQLGERGETQASLEEHYVTFVAGNFRSLRFGSTSAQGPAALIVLNHLERSKAIVRDPETETYEVDVDVMRESVRDLAEKLADAHTPDRAPELRTFLSELSVAGADLGRDLNRLSDAKVPVDVAFEQGPEVLGL